MAKVEQAGDDGTRWMRWVARIWGTLVVVVALLIFSGYAWSWVMTGEADPHAAEDYPPIENWPPRLMFLSALGLAVAWRWEGLGGDWRFSFSWSIFPSCCCIGPSQRAFPTISWRRMVSG